MMLSPQSLNEPYKPFMVMDDKRSVIPDDLLAPISPFFLRLLTMLTSPGSRRD